MADKRHYIALTNGANMFAVAGEFYKNDSDGLIELLQGASILTSTAGAEVVLNCDAAHNLAVGDWVRVVKHRRDAPQDADLIDSTVKYLVTAVPSGTQVQINLTTAALGAGHGGYVGKVTNDLIRLTNVEMILVSDFAQAPTPQQDRIG